MVSFPFAFSPACWTPCNQIFPKNIARRHRTFLAIFAMIDLPTTDDSIIILTEYTIIRVWIVSYGARFARTLQEAHIEA